MWSLHCVYFGAVTSVLFALATSSDFCPPSTPPKLVLARAAIYSSAAMSSLVVHPKGFRGPLFMQELPYVSSPSSIPLGCSSSIIDLPRQYQTPHSLSFPSSLDPRPISKTQNPDITFSSLSTSISNFTFLDSSSNISLQSSPLFLYILMANVVALATAILSLLFRLLSSGERAQFFLLVEKHSILPCLSPVHSLLPPSEELGSLTFGFSTVNPPITLCTPHCSGKAIY